MDYDVVISGAGVAGCATALLYGRAGLRVALLDRRPRIEDFKVVCGHFILGGTVPTLDRLGLWTPMLQAGASVSERMAVWCSSGWIVPPSGAGIPPAISLRRRVLDPLLREHAASTPGVDLLMGHAVVDLVSGTGGRVAGVVCRAPGGRSRELRGRLVVGADGHHSTVARLAGVPESTAPNNRFLFWAYYRDLELRGPLDGQIWLLDPDAAVCCRTDDGLTLVGVFPTKARLPEFAADRLGAYQRMISTLPDGPLLSRAERVGTIVGTTDYPCLRRDPVPRPGLALLGDAATAADPVPAVGVGWAFRSAEWLADTTAPALTAGSDLGPALSAYRRAYRLLERYDELGRREALATPPNRMQRVVRAAAVRDAEVARRMALFAMRAAPPSVLLSPRVLARALVRYLAADTRSAY